MDSKIYALVDCNSFYASCEKVFRPDLRDKAVVVLSNNDGICVALSSEAKAIGIKRGMPVFEVEKIAGTQDVYIFSSNYALYADISRRVMNILRNYTDRMEVYSIDEAFLDLTSFSHLNLIEYGRKMKQAVEKSTGIPVSIGIGPTKTLAKLANEVAKKYKCYRGVFNIKDHPNIKKIFQSYRVLDVWNIGAQYTLKLLRNQVKTIDDFIRLPAEWVKKNMTMKGLQTYKELKGEDMIALEEESNPKKQIISGRSFGYPVTLYRDMAEAVSYHATLAHHKLRSQNSICRYLTVFVETNPFKENEAQYSKAAFIRLDSTAFNLGDLINASMEALTKIFKSGYRYKKTGVILSGILPDNCIQYGLFEPVESVHKKLKLTRAIEKIQKKYGNRSIDIAPNFNKRGWFMRRSFKSPHYTTQWNDVLKIKI